MPDFSTNLLSPAGLQDAIRKAKEVESRLERDKEVVSEASRAKRRKSLDVGTFERLKPFITCPAPTLIR